MEDLEEIKEAINKAERQFGWGNSEDLRGKARFILEITKVKLLLKILEEMRKEN